MSMIGLKKFLVESNAIEGIHGDVEPMLKSAAFSFLHLRAVGIEALNDLQHIIAPGKPLRDQPGMNVRVGSYVAPYGGPHILHRLTDVLYRANTSIDPWEVHVAFETLHPYMDGNGRAGRLLWAWQMARLGRNPFAFSFLHRWYYDTLAADPIRSAP